MNDELITASQLFRKLRKAEATGAERQEFYALLRADNTLLDRLVNQYPQQFEGETPLAEDVKADILQAILGEEEQQPTPAIVHRVHFLRRFRWAAAAIFLLMAGTLAIFLLRQPSKAPVEIAYKGDVAPGKAGARLRLSDGRVIMVDSLKDGLIATDGQLQIIKQNGRIVYLGNNTGADGAVAYNEVIADKGKETSAELPDGSVVYLNAGSSLRYPLHFTGKERLVEMTGEVYFEVVHNATMPFKVRAGEQTIEDIGTSFNVNAYTDEPAAVTTLVEGSIRIGNSVLQPGQQFANGKVSAADVDKAIAWHKGLFSFSHADIPTVMRQLSRWYNVEVVYEGEVPNETFSGEMGRKLMLTEALDGMKRIGIRYRIEGDKKIVILPAGR